MDYGLAPAPREQGWKKFVLALAAFLLMSAIPALAAAVPVEDTAVLLLPVIAACFIAGWWAGGRFVLAVIWVALAAWLLAAPAAPGAAAYRDLASGWGLILAASFGVVCLAGTDRRPFLHRALSAIGIAILMSLLLLAVSHDGAHHAQSVFAEQFAVRNQRWAASVQSYMQQLGVQAPAPGANGGGVTSEYLQWLSTYAQRLNAYSAIMVTVYPAMLALESLMALALGWGLYHRLSRARLGPPLASLKVFTFNDQLIWGLVVGLTFVLLPSFASVAVVGRNLLLFFGALYALRGLGILAWVARRASRWTLAGLIMVGVLFWPIVLAVALAFGISDTWADWRTRMQAAMPPGRHGSPS
ncbi:MAG TPA: hypothetical protein VFJ96_00870 [Gemmatimonadaceae bacterium]|nr:hypothetical protein [Gemmatimonadaceae bacterium]